MITKKIRYAVVFCCILFVTCKKKVDSPCLPSSLQKGLIAYYPFNGNAVDESGYGNDAAFNNAVLTTDRNNKPNKAYYFNGFDSYMKVTNSYYLNPPKITLSAIVKPMGFYKGSCLSNAILYKGFRDEDMYNVYYLRFDATKFTNGATCGVTTVDTIHQNFKGSFAGILASPATPYVEKDKWYHLVYTNDGINAKFYINGNLVESVKSTTQFVASTHDLYIGRTNNPPFPYWFNGVIDELRIYNRAITEQEVKALSSSCYTD